MHNIKNKKVVYTAIFGNRDDLKPIKRQQGFDYIVFTDNAELKSQDFKVLLCNKIFNDSTRNARFYKILSHQVLKEYDYSIWIDANIEMAINDLDILITRYLKNHDLASHAHPIRTCIYSEAEACIKFNLDKSEMIKLQIDKYRKNNYPEDNGLVSSKILFRRHNSVVASFNELWWNEIAVYSKRDQLSFNYVAWKSGFNYFTIPGHVRNRNVDGFTLFPHTD